MDFMGPITKNPQVQSRRNKGQKGHLAHTPFHRKVKIHVHEPDSNTAKQAAIVSRKSQGVPSDVDIAKGKEITLWRNTEGSRSLEGRECGHWIQIFQVKNHLLQNCLKSQTNMCLDIMDQYSIMLHIYLYFKYSMFTVHKVSFSKDVAIATNQGNYSNKPVLCTALIRD